MKKQVCIWPIGCVALEKLKKHPRPRNTDFWRFMSLMANQLKTASITLIG